MLHYERYDGMFEFDQSWTEDNLSETNKGSMIEVKMCNIFT